MWSLNPLFLREKLWVLSSLSVMGCHGGHGIYDKIVSQPLLLLWYSFLLVYLMCVVIQPAFSFFFFKEKIVPYVAVDSVCLWEEV